MNLSILLKKEKEKMKTYLSIFLCLTFLISFAQTKDPNDDGRTIKIPIVFHVISKKKNSRVNDFVTKELIIKEINTLNLNYSARNDMSFKNPNYEPSPGNPNIQFYLADIEGTNGEKGIFRSTGRKNHRRHRILDTSKYLNICVGDYGGSVTSMSPGHKVHIHYTNIGKGKGTVTHELGHYFGLWHVWGKSNCKKNKIGTSRTDNIEDTPKQKNCTDLSKKKPCPTDLTFKNVNANNFMDYSSCRCMFTEKQTIIIRNSIISDRPVIYENSKE